MSNRVLIAGHSQVKYFDQYYAITDFCRSEYEFLLTCKIILT